MYIGRTVLRIAIRWAVYTGKWQLFASKVQTVVKIHNCWPNSTFIMVTLEIEYDLVLDHLKKIIQRHVAHTMYSFNVKAP